VLPCTEQSTIPQAVDDPHAAFRRTQEQSRPLNGDPPGSTVAAFNKWCKEKLTTSQKSAFEKKYKEMQQIYMSKDKEMKSELPTIAVEWGLPVKQAANAEVSWLIRAIAAAIILAE